MKQHIEDILDGLKTGRFPNEASVSQGIVLRLLVALGWPAYDTRIVCPEYALEGLRVDFALCHPATKPRVFIEVKQIGQSDGAERQLFEYAFHKGVPLAILTDGREWNFFLPAEAGNYGERRVYKLDLIERDVQESIRRFERYLKYDAVCSGVAITAARDDYRDVARDREIRDALPKAWRNLVEVEDELLLELLADRVESMCGYKPDLDTVARFFLENIQSHMSSPSATVSKPIIPASPDAPTERYPPKTTSATGFEFQGQFFPCRNARDVLERVVETLVDRDPSFIERFASLARHGRRRRYVARDRNDLYPGRADLAQEHSHRLRSGYWLGINVSRMQVRRIITTACEVAGLRYGSDLIINLGQ